MGHSFDLEFRGNDPASAMGSAWVVVKWQYGPDNVPVVTHDCGSPQELEHAINDLHAELNDILQRAKSKFATNLREKVARQESS